MEPLLPPYWPNNAPAPIQGLARVLRAATEEAPVPWSWDAKFDPRTQVWEVCGWPTPFRQPGIRVPVLSPHTPIDLRVIQDAFESIEAVSVLDGSLVACEGRIGGLAVHLIVVTGGEGFMDVPGLFGWMEGHVQRISDALARVRDEDEDEGEDDQQDPTPSGDVTDLTWN